MHISFPAPFLGKKIVAQMSCILPKGTLPTSGRAEIASIAFSIHITMGPLQELYLTSISLPLPYLNYTSLPLTSFLGFICYLPDTKLFDCGALFSGSYCINTIMLYRRELSET